MKQIEEIKSLINKLKLQSQSVQVKINNLKEDDVSVKYYLNNLKRMSLQSLDLFIAIDKQIGYLENQKKMLLLRNKKRR